MVIGQPYFRPKIVKTLTNIMKPDYKDYPWEGSIDGYADSIEGALYLINRVPVKEGLDWIDREMANNVIYSSEPLDTAKLWGTMKLQANGVRTVIMHALMHTQGVLARPWRKDLKLGASPYNDGLAHCFTSGKNHGKAFWNLTFPVIKFTWDSNTIGPRMNTLPEWFTVKMDEKYLVKIGAAKNVVYTGAQLHTGLAAEIKEGESLQNYYQQKIQELTKTYYLRK